MRPLIGITAYAEPSVRWGAWDVPAAVIPLAYVRQVEAAGGRALLVPPSEEGVDETLDALDGVLFSGGADIDPSEYGHDAHPETNGARPERDRGELALLRAALERDMPVLAVCRGSQVLNVARGGDLVQHLPDVVGDEKHKHTPGVFADHEVDVKEGTRLGSLLGERAPVKSHHHQGFGPDRRRARRVGVGRGRDARGGRGSGQALRGRRALAPGGGRGSGALPRARRRGAGVPGGEGLAGDRRRERRRRGRRRAGRCGGGAAGSRAAGAGAGAATICGAATGAGGGASASGCGAGTLRTAAAARAVSAVSSWPIRASFCEIRCSSWSWRRACSAIRW